MRVRVRRGTEQQLWRQLPIVVEKSLCAFQLICSQRTRLLWCGGQGRVIVLLRRELFSSLVNTIQTSTTQCGV